MRVRRLSLPPSSPHAESASENGHSTPRLPLHAVTRIMKEAKGRPVSPRRGATLDAELMAYGAKQAKKVGVEERDIPRLVRLFVDFSLGRLEAGSAYGFRDKLIDDFRLGITHGSGRISY